MPNNYASDSFFGLSVLEKDKGPAIVVNNYERISTERTIFSAVHELGHLLMHLNSFDISENMENDKEEIEANIFASYFLMPDSGFKSEWRKFSTVLEEMAKN